MKSSSNANSLLLKLHDIKDYDERLSFIQRNLDQFDASLVTVLDELVDSISSNDSTKCQLAFFRAITLAEIAYVFGRVGNITTAKQFASDCLKAHQKGLYLGGQIDVDCSKQTQHLLTALLADAGEFRGFGLENEAWQAYWIADPIYAAIDTQGESVTAGQLLSAAVILERVGMLEAAAKARQEALTRIGDEGRFSKEKAMVEKIVGSPPTELPPPDIYDGLTIETALRFSSQTVGVRCVQQTRCPRCRGPMDYKGSTSFVRENGYYRKCQLTCKKDPTHPALTLFRNNMVLPDTKIFVGLGYQLDRQEQERLNKSGALSDTPGPTSEVSRRRNSKAPTAKGAEPFDPPPGALSAGLSAQGDTTSFLASYLMERTPEERAKILEPYKEYFKPRWPKPRVLFIYTAIFLIICVWISLVPAFVGYLVLRWSGLPSPFLRVLFGCAAGLVLFHLFMLLARRSALQNFIRRIDLLSTADRPAKLSRARLLLVTLLGLAAGCVSALLIGGWAGMAAMPLAALNLRVVLKRMALHKKW